MDTDTSYLLKIHLLGNPKKSRKDVRCFSLEKVVDVDFTNYTDLVQSFVQQYPLGYLEVPHVQYYDAELKTFPDVTSDQELMECSVNIRKRSLRCSLLIVIHLNLTSLSLNVNLKEKHIIRRT
jgi:hypothetical protein